MNIDDLSTLRGAGSDSGGLDLSVQWVSRTALEELDWASDCIRDTRLIVAICSEAGGDSDTSPKSQAAAHSHVRSAPAWVCTHPQLPL